MSGYDNVFFWVVAKPGSAYYAETDHYLEIRFFRPPPPPPDYGEGWDPWGYSYCGPWGCPGQIFEEGDPSFRYIIDVLLELWIVQDVLQVARTSAELQVPRAVIFFNGSDVTNRSSNVIIGQSINLSVTADGTISTVTWTVPGTIIGGYATSPTEGTTSSARLDIQSPSFYWVNGASARIISVRVTLSDGRVGRASTTFNVAAPSGSMSATSLGADNILIDTSCGYLCVHYGPITSPGGAHFSHTYVPPSGYGGSFQWVQVGSSSQSRTNPITGTQTLTCDNQLDTVYPYSTGSATWDSPAQQLPYGYSDRQRSDSFTMTLMFRPTGASAIFVPIARVSWGWAFHTISSDAGITWSFLSKTAAGTLSPGSSTIFPTWSGNLVNCVSAM